jgi:hypothetical protein
LRHRITDDVTVNVKVDIPTEDLEELIEKTTDAVLTIIAATTAAYIIKSLFRKETP